MLVLRGRGVYAKSVCARTGEKGAKIMNLNVCTLWMTPKWSDLTEKILLGFFKKLNFAG